MRKTFWCIVALATLFFGVGCKQVTDDEDVTVDGTVSTNSTVSGTATVTIVEDEVYEYIGSASGTLTIRNYDYFGDSSSYTYTTDSSYNYTYSFYDGNGDYHSAGYYKNWYSRYRDTTYTLTSGKVEKSTYQNKNYTKYVVTLYGYETSHTDIDADGTKTTTKSSSKTPSFICSRTVYEAGGTYYADTTLTKDSIKFSTGTFDSSYFSLSSADDTSVRYSSSSNDYHSTSSYYYDYDYYTITEGKKYTFSSMSFSKK